MFRIKNQMLRIFYYWEHNYPDIITGWNINKLILYIVNRIIKILGDGNQYDSPINAKNVYTSPNTI